MSKSEEHVMLYTAAKMSGFLQAMSTTTSMETAGCPAYRHP